MNIQNSTHTKTEGLALVELFTSEGCSSCPPADEVMEELQREYKDKNVLLLAFHVDYWDQLGWKDIFSSANFTERQNYYASVFNLSSVYTPQAIINGSEEFVGSNKSGLEKAVEDHLKEVSTAAINLNAKETSAGKIQISYSTQGNNSENEQLVLLLVQNQATNKIGRGENEGRTLHHINIVKEISYLPIPSKEEIAAFVILSENKKEDFFIAAFVQNKKTGKITALAASKID